MPRFSCCKVVIKEKIAFDSDTLNRTINNGVFFMVKNKYYVEVMIYIVCVDL